MSVRPLTEKQRIAEIDKNCNRVFLTALGAYRYSRDMSEGEVARAMNIDPTTLTRWKKDTSRMSLSKARAAARLLKMTPEQWLAFGGYKIS